MIKSFKIIVDWTRENDLLIGTNENDKILGKSGDDTLSGAEGNDVLNGGLGVDEMAGGLGDDRYLIDNSADLIIELENEGNDRIITSTTNYALPENVEQLVFRGTENLEGEGNELNNRLLGNQGNNILSGNDGNDFLIGKEGNDILTGGNGRDKFIFSNAIEGIDTINDFTSGVDKIRISADGFGGDLIKGKLSNDQFVLGTTALNEDTRFIYTPQGELFYDGDGTGILNPTHFVNLLGIPSLSAKDIIVF